VTARVLTPCAASYSVACPSETGIGLSDCQEGSDNARALELESMKFPSADQHERDAIPCGLADASGRWIGHWHHTNHVRMQAKAFDDVCFHDGSAFLRAYEPFAGRTLCCISLDDHRTVREVWNQSAHCIIT
jgi:hypothetical protein